MRLTYVIRSINFWFARVVYERDRWDMELESLSKQSSFGMLIAALNLARGWVWLSRRILWVLMTIGNAVSCFALRQMEYDADGYEARIAGTEAFIETMDKLPLLSAATQAAHEDISKSWETRRLADDVPVMIDAKMQLHLERQDIVEKIADHILGAVPPADNVLGLYQTGSMALERFGELYYRCLASLCYLAEQAESALGLPPLPEPAPKEPSKEPAMSEAETTG